MVEIDITAFVMAQDPYLFSASRAELGDLAGRITWMNAVNEAERAPMLNAPESLEAMRDWARSSGGWDDTEISAWSDQKLNALFIQLVSGDLREAGFDDCYVHEFDWETYYRRASEGEISGRMYLSDDGEIYYTLE